MKIKKKFLSLVVFSLIVILILPGVSPAFASKSMVVSANLVDLNGDGFKDVIFTAKNGLGVGVSQAEIELYFKDPLTLVFRGKTDNEGKLIILSIPPGDYRWKLVSTEEIGDLEVESWNFYLDETDDFLLSVLLMEAAQHTGVTSPERCKSLFKYLAALLGYNSPLPSADHITTSDNVEILSAWFFYTDGLIQKLDSGALQRASIDLDKAFRALLNAAKFSWAYWIKTQINNIIWRGDSLYWGFSEMHRINLLGTGGSFLLALIPALLDLFNLPDLIRVTFVPDPFSPENEWRYVEFVTRFTSTLTDTAAAWYWGVAWILKNKGLDLWTKYKNYAIFATKIAIAINVAIIIIQIYQLYLMYQNYQNLYEFIKSPEFVFALVELGVSVGFVILSALVVAGVSSSWVPIAGWILFAISVIAQIINWWWYQMGPGYEDNVRKLRDRMSSALTSLINLKEMLDNVDFEALRKQADFIKKFAVVISELSSIASPDERYSLMCKYYHLNQISECLSTYVSEGLSLKNTGDLEEVIKTCLYWKSKDGKTIISAYASGVNSTVVFYDKMTCNATVKYPHKRSDGSIVDAYDENYVWIDSSGNLRISHNRIYGEAWTRLSDKWYGDLPHEQDRAGNKFIVTVNVSDIDHPVDFDYIDKSVSEDSEEILDQYEKNAKYDIKENGWYFHYKFYPKTDEWSREWTTNNFVIPVEWEQAVQSAFEKIQLRIKALVESARKLSDLNSNPPRELPIHIEAKCPRLLYKAGEKVDIIVISQYKTLPIFRKASMLATVYDPYGQIVTLKQLEGEFDSNNEYSGTFSFTISDRPRSGWYKLSVDVRVLFELGLKFWLPVLDDVLMLPIFYVYKLEVLWPTSLRIARAGDPAKPNTIYAAVIGLPGKPSFHVKIGGLDAPSCKLVDLYFSRFGIYTLEITPPAQSTEGKYDLTITANLEAISVSTTEKDAVEYGLYPSHDPLEKGLAWLRTQQYGDGSWQSSVGVTALCALAFLNAGYDETDITVSKAINYILANVKPDGSIYITHPTYETSLAMLPLVATRNDAYKTIIENAKNWLVNSQWDESCLWGSVSIDDWYYGGFGYGSSQRPDLSNTQFALLALDAAGLPKDHSLWVKAQVFLHRCQKVNFPITLNIEGTPYTVQPWKYAGTTGGYDGGFLYVPGGNAYVGGAPSMGSMTGAGIWGLLLSGVPKTDQRVTEAINWVVNHYTWDDNPNCRGNRRYYYYLTMAKALTMYGEKTIDGHDWYQELYNKITSPTEMITVDMDKVKWVPTTSEDYVPELSTAYAILSLQTRTTAPPVERLSYFTFILRSNCLIRVIDPEGNLVGYNYMTGLGENNMPMAVCSGPFMEPQYIVIVNPQAGVYRLELIGISEGPYELTIQGNYGEEVMDVFEYAGEIKPAELYGCDVTVTAIVGPIDVYASPPEFEEIIDNIPPSTKLNIGEPKYVSPTNNIYVSSVTPITLIVEDDLGGIGVASTFYRVSNVSYDTGWLNYFASFSLLNLMDGQYNLAFYSVDRMANAESAKQNLIYLDNASPSLLVEIVSSRVYAGDSATFNLTVSDLGSGVCNASLYVDGELVADWTADGVYTFVSEPLKEGKHSFYAVAVDNLGNTVTSDVYEFEVFPRLPSRLIVVFAVVAIIACLVIALLFAAKRGEANRIGRGYVTRLFYPAEVVRACPLCSGVLRYDSKSNRWYCERCRRHY